MMRVAGEYWMGVFIRPLLPLHLYGLTSGCVQGCVYQSWGAPLRETGVGFDIA